MIKIRKASPLDKQFIVQFQLEMALETENLRLNKAIVDSGVEAVLNDHSKGEYFVAENDGLVIGSLLITYEWSDWRNGRIWWLQSLYVIPEWRRQGIFKTMFRHLQRLVEEDDSIKGLRLYVDRSNLAAQRVYKALGMNGEHYQVFEWMKPL